RRRGSWLRPAPRRTLRSVRCQSEVAESRHRSGAARAHVGRNAQTWLSRCLVPVDQRQRRSTVRAMRIPRGAQIRRDVQECWLMEMADNCIMVVGAHAADAEIMGGATVLKHVDAGWRAVLVHMTPGEKGHRTLSAEEYARIKEAE